MCGERGWRLVRENVDAGGAADHVDEVGVVLLAFAGDIDDGGHGVLLRTGGAGDRFPCQQDHNTPQNRGISMHNRRLTLILQRENDHIKA